MLCIHENPSSWLGLLHKAAPASGHLKCSRLQICSRRHVQSQILKSLQLILKLRHSLSRNHPEQRASHSTQNGQLIQSPARISTFPWLSQAVALGFPPFLNHPIMGLPNGDFDRPFWGAWWPGSRDWLSQDPATFRVWRRRLQDQSMVLSDPAMSIHP
jgi:hypothetical protein